MKYDENDLIRKPLVRTMILASGILMIVFGIMGWKSELGWKSLFVLFGGVGLLIMLHYSYENLLEEKYDKADKGVTK